MIKNDFVKCVIFDMDGCLVDTEAIYIRSWKHAFEIKKIKVSDDFIESWAGLGTNYINNEIYNLTQDINKAKEIREIRENIFVDYLNNGEVELKPYANEILSFLKEENIKVGLASSTFQFKALKILNYFNLVNFFDFMVYGDQVDNLKPAPDIYLKALEVSKEEPSNCIIFEDSLSGVTAAKAAGFTRIIHVPDSHVKKNQVYLNTYLRVDDFSKAIEVIKKNIEYCR